MNDYCFMYINGSVSVYDFTFVISETVCHLIIIVNIVSKFIPKLIHV